MPLIYNYLTPCDTLVTWGFLLKQIKSHKEK